MRILLVAPPIEDFFFTPVRAYPLGLLSLATVLKNAGFEVKIINCLETQSKITLPTPAKFAYLKRYYQANHSPFRLFNQYYRFGLDYPQLKQQIKDYSPDVVGISANFTAYLETSFETARLVKEIDKNIKVVLGGRAVTSWPGFVLKNPDVDFVLRGEAEFSLLKLCQGLSKSKLGQIEGLGYKVGKKLKVSPKIVLIKDLNKLPILDRELIDWKRYKYQENVSTALLASRGCPCGCGFCAIREKFRPRKASLVLEEVSRAYKLGCRHFNFEDDNINLHPEFEKIIDGLINRFADKIKISFMNGMLSLGLDSAMRDKLIKAGLTHLDLAVASSSLKLRQDMSRSEKVSRVFKVSGAFAKKNIVTTAHFIVGLPGQRFNDCLKDVRSLASKPVLLGPSIFYPVAESKVFESLPENLKNQDNFPLFRSSAACFEGNISRDRIFTIIYASRIVNLLKEFIDKYELDQKSFYPFIRSRLKLFKVKDNRILVKEKMVKDDLIVVLVELLIKENKVYRVLEKKGLHRYEYEFIKEGFCDFLDIQKCFSSMIVESVCGRTIKLL